MRTLVQRDDARIQSLAEHDNPAGRLRDQRSTVVTLRTVRRVLRDATRHRWEVFPRVISLAVKGTDCLLNLCLSLLRFRHHRRKRSEEHTSELQSPCNLVCRLLLEKKKKNLKMLTD